MAKKESREIFYFAMLNTEFEKLKKFLDDDIPVYLTFLSSANYKGDNNEKRILVKTVIEKVEG